MKSLWTRYKKTWDKWNPTLLEQAMMYSHLVIGLFCAALLIGIFVIFCINYPVMGILLVLLFSAGCTTAWAASDDK